jgi:hypothetical protein
MPKTLLTEIQQASLVLFNVACLYTPAFTGFFSEIVPKIKKLKKLNSPELKTLNQAQKHEFRTVNYKS